MAWQNDPLVLYHGTVGPFADDISQRKRPDLTKARARSDFSVGFYTTRVRKQAEDFANKKYHRMLRLYQQNSMNLDPRSAAVVELSIDRNNLGRLDTLAFVFGEVDWHDFVTYCRSGIRGHRGTGRYYDVVYGPASTNTGEWWKYEQLSFHTTPAINQLGVVAVHLGNPRFT